MVLNRTQQIIIAVIIAIIIAIIMRYLLYNYTGWISFTMNKSENFMPIDNFNSFDKIKFKKCIYTIKGKNGESFTQDVTHALNRMVAAFTGVSDSKYKFKLVDPGLDTNSFQIEGYNDNNNTRDVNNWDGDGTTATLTGFYKFVN